MNLFCYWLIRSFLSKYRWYRRWYGGRWECYWIEATGSFIWHDMPRNPLYWYPSTRPVESRGTPEIEDYPYKDV